MIDFFLFGALFLLALALVNFVLGVRKIKRGE